MADVDIPKTKYTIQEILNLILADTDDSGEPNAIKVCNPNGTNIGS